MSIPIALSKRRFLSLVIIILGILTQDFAEAQTTEIKVLYVYTTSVKNKPEYGDINEDLLIKMKAQVEAVLALSGLPAVDLITVGHREIVLSGSNPVVEDNLTVVQLQALSRDQDPAKRLTTSAGESIEELRAALGADIAVMIYDESKTAEFGGTASITADGNLPSHSFPWPEIHLISITDKAAFSNDLIFAHEIGHILGCRHPNGTGPGTDNGTVPFPNCHGYVFPDGQHATVMATVTGSCIPPTCTIIPFFSDQDEDFINGGVNEGKRGDANADAVASLAAAAATVATYGDNLMPPAPPTVPAFCDPDPQFLGCSGPGIAKWAATWNAPLGAVIIEYILELDDTNTGNFEEAYRGELEGLTCPAPGSTDRLIYRVAYRTITGTSPYCTIVNVFRNCPNPYPNGGGPIP